ncbi:MAG TPA: hypothetical protein PLU30_16590 [Verrucomicrobiae bacterium]|mgnify:CR=1 FL=1|nr:hypothetical protein [Verrucomicrobiae bacterium]
MNSTIKKPLGSLVGILCVTTAMGQTNVWRVDPIAGHPRDFATITDALNSSTVKDGDTVLVTGDFSTTDVTLQRRLHLVGFGYYLAENGISYPPGTLAPATIRSLLVRSAAAGSPTNGSGSSITGFTLTTDATFNDVSRVVFRRNNVRKVVIAGANGQAASGISVIQNYIRALGTDDSYGAIRSETWDNYDILIANNFIGREPAGSFTMSANDVFLIRNNIIRAGGWIHNGLFADNAVYGQTTMYWNKMVVQNNIAIGGNFLPAGSSNINNQVESNVFVLGTSPDGKYQLAAGSLAIGAASDGGDMGMYGGTYPYVLSGLPPVPVITLLSIPNTVPDGEDLQVQIRAEVHP